jgi:hypothetical protein
MTPERQRELGRWRNPPAFFMPPPNKSPIHCQPPVLHPVCAAAHTRYLLRDRDAIYGADFVHRVKSLGLEQKLIAPRAPWQNPVAERLIGSLRRECLDHVIVLNEKHLRGILTDYLGYYHAHRPHRFLAQDCPEPRAIELPNQGEIIELPFLGGLHHRYTRQAA